MPFDILRRAVIKKKVFLQTMRQVTGRPKSDLTKARRFLVASGLVKIRPSRKDRRMVCLRPTPRGIRVLARMDRKIEERLVRMLGMNESGELIKFARTLEKANSLLPDVPEDGPQHRSPDSPRPKERHDSALQLRDGPKSEPWEDEEDDDDTENY